MAYSIYKHHIFLKYFLILLKGVFLKDISFAMAISLIIPMLVLGFISLIFAAWMFRKKSWIDLENSCDIIPKNLLSQRDKMFIQKISK